jgi:hypothetical protein
MSRILLIAAAAFAILGLSGRAARADEGLWTFDNFPAAAVKAGSDFVRSRDATIAAIEQEGCAGGRLNRGVSVSTAAITEALEKVYRNPELVKELRAAH